MPKICKAFLLTFIILLFFASGHAQNKNEEVVVSESWHAGNETLTPQRIDLTLSAEHKDYQTFIVGNSGKKYRLSVVFMPMSDNALTKSGKSNEGWMVELREIKTSRKNKENVGLNLLTRTKEELGQDYFPKENSLIYLMNEGSETYVKRYYPIKTIRKIKVEGFYVTIKVKDYQLNAADNRKVDYLNVLIELENVSDKTEALKK